MSSKSSASPKPQKHPNNIRKAIKTSGMKFYEVAEETNIPKDTLATYCAGLYPVPKERLEALAKSLQCSKEYLVPPLPKVREAYRSHSQSEETKDLEALLVLRMHCQQHPTDENALQQLLELLGKFGRDREIEECYERFLKAVKKEDFWREPDACTTQLLAQLRTQVSVSVSSGVSEKGGEGVQTGNEPTPSPDLNPGSAVPSLDPDTQTTAGSSDKSVVLSIVLPSSQFQIFVQPLQNATQTNVPQPVLVSSPYVVESSTKNAGFSSSSDIPLEGTMDTDTGLEGEKTMDQQRREMLQVLKSLGLVGATTGIPVIGQQDLIAEVQRLLHQPSLVPGDKEVKLLEQKILLYWEARATVTIVPTDMVLHATVYVQEVWTLLHHSLLPDIRVRLCACLSQGLFLIGASFFSIGQFQTARVYYQTAIDAAHEANNNILQALLWKNDSFSWIYSSEPDRYQHALDGMLKACHFASLESDRAVDCSTQAALAEVYALGEEKDACLGALKRAAKLGGSGHGDWYFIHRFDDSRLNGFRGICLQQFYQRDDSNTHPLLEESRQALQEASSQQNVGVRQRAFLVVDMAQVHAREGEVESACDSARRIIDIAGADTLVLQRLLMVRTQLEPYADVVAVKELDREMGKWRSISNRKTSMRQ